MIDGLHYLPDAIPPDTRRNLLHHIDTSCWRDDLSRRVQHYGYLYDYRARRVGRSSYLGPLPDWLQELADQLRREHFAGRSPDQAIVNDYLPGQGIAPHVDCLPCFGDVVASVSLCGSAEMAFQKGEDTRSLRLEPGSLLVLSGTARFEWTHGIAARKSDVVEGVRVKRERRVSVTFRTVRVE